MVLASQGLGARGGALWIVKPDQGVHLEVTHGVMGERERLGRSLKGLAVGVIESIRPRFVEQTTVV